VLGEGWNIIPVVQHTAIVSSRQQQFWRDFGTIAP